MALAAQEAGAEYIFDAATETIEITGRKVIIGASKNGNSISIEAKSVVVASGFNPKFTRMLGLGQIEYSATGWQTEVDTNGMVEAEVYFGKNVAPGFFAWLVPFSPGRAKLGLLSRNGGGALLQTFWSDMYSRGKVTSPITETYHGAVPLKPLAKTYNDRVLVVGDAAGQVKPTTGGGIYYGLLCSTIAAACLHEAIARDDFSSKMLKKYQDEWHKKLYAELKVTYLARRAFQKLSDKQIDNIFETVSSKSIHEELLSEEDFSFDWHGKLILKALKYPSLWNPLGLLAYQIRHFHKQPYYSP
ncbi:MAG: NAD(P)/FAD-dependent oxidoreductase [Dehalococcoidia bacterium]|nr:NAD(P)/FAD-dependent oxidoreductase [Dehalococcoidia bacterium]